MEYISSNSIFPSKLIIWDISVPKAGNHLYGQIQTGLVFNPLHCGMSG